MTVHPLIKPRKVASASAQRESKLKPMEIRASNPWMARPPIEPTAVYTMDEAAFVLALSTKTLERARQEPEPKRLRCAMFGDAPRFLGRDLLAWFEAHVAPASEAPTGA